MGPGLLPGAFAVSFREFFIPVGFIPSWTLMHLRWLKPFVACMSFLDAEMPGGVLKKHLLGSESPPFLLGDFSNDQLRCQPEGIYLKKIVVGKTGETQKWN